MLVSIEKSAEEDLEKLWEEDEAAAADIEVLLAELENGPEWLWRMTRPEGWSNYSVPLFDTRPFRALYKKGMDVFRIKPLDVGSLAKSYRVLYACDNRNDHIHVLAIVHRSFNYAQDHKITRRIRREYDCLLGRHSAY